MHVRKLRLQRWDSNPREAFTSARFSGERHKPLRHLWKKTFEITSAGAGLACTHIAHWAAVLAGKSATHGVGVQLDATQLKPVVPGARIELATPAFSGRRSTNELPRLC